MSKFYTHIHQSGDKIYVRGYDCGLRFRQSIKFKPYIFLPDKDGDYKTVEGLACSKREFKSIKTAKKFIEDYKTVVNFKYFGLTNFIYLYLYDNYKNIEYDPALIKIGSIDIETRSNNGFPNILTADQEITLITLRLNNRNAVFGCHDFVTDDPNTFYTKCDSEEELLLMFIEIWESDAWNPDIITGWNITNFDIPYIINRIKRLLGDDEAKRLSPYKTVYEKTVEFRGKMNQTYDIVGVAILDYYELYRKFSPGNEESYKLDYIAQIKLGEKKLDYSMYPSIDEFYLQNPQKFTEYNIHDAVLVAKLEDKLGYIKLIITLAYLSGINYVDSFTTIRPWDIRIHNYLMDQKIVIPPAEDQEDMEALVGGYVKEPQIGMHGWGLSKDLKSSYPHQTMQYNISPETCVGRIKDFYSIEDMLNLVEMIKTEHAIAPNGCLYRKDVRGFIPVLMEKMFAERSHYSKLLKESEEKYKTDKSPELANAISRYDKLQYAIKIQLNALYGALANKYFRWFSFNVAESITTGGQLSVRWVARDINTFINKFLKTENVDYILAQDTDSAYINLQPLVEAMGFDDKNNKDIVDLLNKFDETFLNPVIYKSFDELAVYMNAYANKMQMNRELIFNKAFWRKKKHYIINVIDKEGKFFDPPKQTIHGIEVVRSSTPYVCREKMKKAINIIMNGTIDELRKLIDDFRDEFERMPFTDVAFPRGMNNVEKYDDEEFIYTKGTPIHVKGALIYNSMIENLNLKLPKIVDGDKIKFCYLKLPNPARDKVISAPSELPPELKLDKYVDHTMQFNKTFFYPIQSITDKMGWNITDHATLEAFL